MANLNWKGKIVVYTLAASVFFGSGILLSGPIKNAAKKDPYKNKEAAVSFYQDYKTLELEKIVNKNQEVEIYLTDKENDKRIKVGYDLITGNNEEIYAGLEKRLEQNISGNEKIIDGMFDKAYDFKIASNLGNQVKEGYSDPSELKLNYNETPEGDYLSIENKVTGEILEFYSINGRAQLGTMDYRASGLKDELGSKAYEYFKDFNEKRTGIFDWFLNLFAGGG